MDEFSEKLVRETVPVVMRVLGLPPDLADRAVRHAFTCPKAPCEVHDYLMDRVNAKTAEVTGVPQAQVDEVIKSTTKATVDTLAMQHRLGIQIGIEQLRAAYESGEQAADLAMDYLMEKP